MKTGRETADSAAIAIYVRHAQRFGTDEVIASAVEKNVGFSALVMLQTKLDEIDATKRRRGQTGPRLSAETRVKRLLGIEDEEKEV